MGVLKFGMEKSKNGKNMGGCQKFGWKNPKYGNNLVVGVISGRFWKMGKISSGDPPTHLHRNFFTLILLEFGGILSRTTLDLLRHNPIMDWFEFLYTLFANICF